MDGTKQPESDILGMYGLDDEARASCALDHDPECETVNLDSLPTALEVARAKKLPRLKRRGG